MMSTRAPKVDALGKATSRALDGKRATKGWEAQTKIVELPVQWGGVVDRPCDGLSTRGGQSSPVCRVARAELLAIALSFRSRTLSQQSLPFPVHLLNLARGLCSDYAMLSKLPPP